VYLSSAKLAQIHLPGQHLVRFDPDEDLNDVLSRGAQEKSQLTAYFAACSNSGPLGQSARQHTYQEFPRHFVYDATRRQWKKRQRGTAIGRMFFVSPTAGERFYLRTLLCVVRGARSFEDLCTHRGHRYSTFREACLARGLLEDDGEWRQCLEEACHMQTGTRLRLLFVMILNFCRPACPDALWITYRQGMCDDLRYRLTSSGVASPSEEQVFDYGLYLINQLLGDYGRTLCDFPPMPLPQRQDWGRLSENPHIAEQLDYNPVEEMNAAQERERLLNSDQQHAYEAITMSVLTNQPQLYFLDGPGGTGKTYVYNTICNRLCAETQVVLCVASSGIAALLLSGGRTAHSTFKIPVEQLHQHSTCGIAKESQYAQMLAIARLLIWDEAGNQSRYAFEAVDRLLQDVRDDHRAFGGMTVVFGGDFRQTLPIVPRGSREEIVSHTLRKSYLWSHIRVLRLRQNMRLGIDEASVEYAQWLLDIGSGIHAPNVKIQSHMCAPDLKSLIENVYGGITPRHSVPPPEYFQHRSILSARNSDVDEVNHSIIQLFPGHEEILLSADSVVHEDDAEADTTHHYPMEYLRSLRPAGLPPGELQLKHGCPIILLRNLAPRRGLCNGTRLVVVSVGERVLQARIIGGDHDGELAFIPRLTLSPSNSNTELAFKLNRRQFPVRLAFSMSINKAQGQSVKYVGLDLRSPVFAHGQLYVALSRATSPHCVHVLLPPDAHGYTHNIVYPEILLSVSGSTSYDFSSLTSRVYQDEP
jgi:DNA replication protein DnaC